MTTKASSYGYMVPTLSSSEKLIAGQFSSLAFFGSGFESSEGSRATNITLEGWEPVLPGAAKMTLMVPKGGLEEAFPWAPDPAWSPCPLGWYKNYFNLPSLTSCSRWFHKILQSLVVCPRSWWYWQWRMLRTYFYVIGISFDKTHFTCIWVSLRRLKMIITSG